MFPLARPYRIALVLLYGIAWGVFGYIEGRSHADTKQAECGTVLRIVKSQGEAQNANTIAVNADQDKITKDIQNEITNARKLISGTLSAVRVLKSTAPASAGQMPDLPGRAACPDGASEKLPAFAGELAECVRNGAQDAFTILKWQDWYNREKDARQKDHGEALSPTL